MDPESLSLLAEKITNPGLYQIVVEGSGGKISVLIEPDIPAQQVHVETSSRLVAGMPQRTFLEESPEEQMAARDVIEKTRALLEHTTGKTPHWLRAGRAFVADVTPHQLQSLARSPLIKAIRPNRRLE